MINPFTQQRNGHPEWASTLLDAAAIPSNQVHLVHSGYENRNERAFAHSVVERIAVKLAEIDIGSHELCSVAQTAVVSVAIAEGCSCAWLGY